MMVYLTKLVLRNVQKHEYAEYVFDRYLNVIVGDNNAGKSSIVRAVYWLWNNKPSGDWIRRFDPTKNDGTRLTTTVEAHLSTGIVVSRIKGNSINSYKVGNEEFTSTGRSVVPAQVQKVLRNVELPFGKELTPCMALPDEPPFMIFESGPTRGSLINYLTGVDLADKIKRDLAKDASSLTHSINTSEERIKRISEELQDYADVDSIENKITALEKLSKDYDDVSCRLNELQSILTEHIRLTANVNRYEKFIEYASSLIPLFDEWKVVSEALPIFKRLHDTEKTIAILSQITDLEEAVVEQCEMDKQIREIKILKNEHNRYEDTHNINEQEILQLKDQLSKFKKCPICGNKLKSLLEEL